MIVKTLLIGLFLLSVIKIMSLKLPKNTSLQDLYLEEDQTIWFLIWVLKQSSPCDQYISEMILESPFQVRQNTWVGYPRKYILKNGKKHGMERGWWENGQLRYESYWKNWEKHGMARGWYQNGQFRYEYHLENGQRHGPARGWDENGQLSYEENWKNGKK